MEYSKKIGKLQAIEWENVPKDISKYLGFVYLITELDTGLKYIGKKNYWKIVKLPALKGRTKKEKARRAKLKGNKRHVCKETDWKTYNSSHSKKGVLVLSDKINANPSNYQKKIIFNCNSKMDLSIMETKFQIDEYLAGNWDQYFNQVINLRVRIRKSKK